MRFFNTAGPVKEEDHYCLPQLDRLNLDDILMLIDQKKYFILHAPRQTGKYRCLYCNVESAQGARENVKRGVKAILNEIATSARLYLKDGFLTDNLYQIHTKDTGQKFDDRDKAKIWNNRKDSRKRVRADNRIS